MPASALARAALVITPCLVACGARTGFDLLDFDERASLDSGVIGPSGGDSGGVDDGSSGRDGAVDAFETDGGGVSDDSGGEDNGCGEPWVVFVVSEGDDPSDQSSALYAIRADGSDLHALVIPHDSPAFPWVSADGASLVYTTDSGSHLFLRDIAAQTEQEIPVTGSVVDGFAALSPDGTFLTFGTTNGIVRADLGSSPPYPLLVPTSPFPLGGAPDFPVVTPDSQNVIFGARTVVGEVSASGNGTPSALISNTGGFSGVDSAALSPDGTTLIAGVECPPGNFALRTYPLASLPAAGCTGGAVVVPLSAPGATPFYPAWGPTNLIAYWDESTNILLVSASGGVPVALVGGSMGAAVNGAASMPAWAPSCTPL
jgi:hypothetical protein